MKWLILTLLVLPNIAQAKDFYSSNKKVISDIIWAADKAEIPRELVLSICYGESNFKTKGVTHLDGETVSHGICQVKLETAQHMDMVYKHKTKATSERLEDTKVNAFYAAKYLKYLLNEKDDNWRQAVDAYNRGLKYATGDSEYVDRFVKYLEFIRTHINKKVIYGSANPKALQ